MKRWILILSCILFSMELLIAQTTKTAGTIYDENGEPIIGALVKVKGHENIGATTNVDGKFELNVPDGSKMLIVAYLGMKTQEVEIKPVLTIHMVPDSHELGEVVVTGMAKIDKRLFTGATDKIEADKAKLDGVQDVSRALEGRSAGVSVQNVSGTFGTAPKIRVRGATSIYGNSKPLWVVDGVIVEDALDVSSDALSSGNAETLLSSAIAGLNADDIESFQILKDGSATSIYGARAMSGVIVITTKKGTAGVSKLSYTGEFTTRLKPSYRDFNISNSQQQIGIYKEMEEKGWLKFETLAPVANFGVYGKMLEMINSPIYDESGNINGFELMNRQKAMNEYLRQAEFRNTNWFDLLFNQNMTQNHTVGISSGTDKSKFYVSLSAFNDPGWYKSSEAERYTANINSSYNILPELTINLLANGSYRKQRAPGTLGQDVDVVNGEVKRDFDINPYSYALNTSRVLDPNQFYRSSYAAFNIFHELENNYMDLDVIDLKFQGELTWKPVKGLDVNFLSALRVNSSAYEHHIKDQSNQAKAYRAGVDPVDDVIRESNPLLYTDPDDDQALPISILPKGGIYNRTAISMRGIDLRLSANYNTVFEDTHIMNLFGGMETNNTQRERSWFRGWGYEYDNGGNPYYDYLVFKQGKEDGSTYYNLTRTYSRNASFFAQGIYSYKGRYTLNTGGRYEGTNRLGKSRAARWLPTWSVSGAWTAHEEEWFKDAVGAVLSHGTLKASYSLTADPPPVTNALPVFASYNPWRPTASDGESGLQLNGIANEELTFEKKHEFNVGVDLGFANNRINLSADFYTRNNYDLIGVVYTQGVGGESMKLANVAEMKSHGIEFTLSTKNIQTEHFSWTTDFIFSKSSNEITELNSRMSVMELITGTGFVKGYPHRALFSIPFVRLNEDGIPVFINQNNEETVTDINFQEFENLGFLKYEGAIDPTIIGSLGNVFTWKNFKLNTFITYSFGNKVRLNPVFRASYSDLTSMPKEFKNRWAVAGDEAHTTVPVIASLRDYNRYGSNLAYAYNAYNYSTERIADGGFIRLKEVSLSYDFPPQLIGKKISNLQLKLQATNLFLLYADKKLNGQDPEFVNSGGVASPMPKQFTFTLRFGI